jgi:hypothetical protein
LIRLPPSFAKKFGNGLINGNQHHILDTDTIGNPSVQSSPWWNELYQRIKLLPWWIKYNAGQTRESELKDRIIQLASQLNLEKKWVKKIIRHAVSEFSKKGLGQDYYGYHNIDHELEATYFTLLAAKSHIGQNNIENKDTFTMDDVKYLFVSALFHDYDPAKHFDKPNEESVEWFLRNDPEILRFIDVMGIDIDIVVAIIYRTAYPFNGDIAKNAMIRIQELLSCKYQLKDKQSKDKGNRNILESKLTEHYLHLGRFLSVCERMAGYTLGDFEYANKLARSNAHALGWHPSVINGESVRFFNAIKQENEMLQFVLSGIPEKLKQNFFSNIELFEKLYEEELKIRSLTKKREIGFICKVESILKDYNDGGGISYIDPDVRNCVLNIYNKLPIPLKRGEQHFLSSLSNPNTILITLRIKTDQTIRLDQNDNNNSNTVTGDDIKKAADRSDEKNAYGNGTIVGYVKGGPLEKYSLRRGTFDENRGKKNTVYMEWICIKPGYWGSTGGHLLRINFLMEAKKRGYAFVTGYVHRNVIMKRRSKGEIIQIVQKYDPDKLDYYRIDLSKISITDMVEEGSDEFAMAVYP